MRGILPIAICALAILTPVLAFAQDDNGLGIGQPLPDIAPSDCAAPQIVNAVQMIHLANRDGDLVPVVINGRARNFLLDTGSYATQIQRPVAEELGLPIKPSNIEVYGLTGQMAREDAFVQQFAFGRQRGNDVTLPVSPDIDSARTSDGFFAVGDLAAYDIDVDFGTDKLIFYSRDHCPGVLPFWAMSAASVIPITRDDNHIVILVTLDGRQFRAWLDTGATFTALEMSDAQNAYGLTMGDAGTPEIGTLNDDPALKTYSHNFGKLTFGDITITAPRITIIPNVMAKKLEESRRAGAPVATVAHLIQPPELIIGMDVLRKLHLYMALAENRMYISRASEPTAQNRTLQAALQPQTALQARFRQIASKAITDMDGIIAQDPKNVPALNERCYMRAAMKTDLGLARADCEEAARLRPKDDKILDSLAFLLYQQGQYRAALDTYNRVLALNAASAPSRFMRGYAKGMLGDSAGKDADIQAATRAMPDLPRLFQQYDISYFAQP